MGTNVQKNEVVTSSLCHKANSKQIVCLNVKAKTTKTLRKKKHRSKSLVSNVEMTDNKIHIIDLIKIKNIRVENVVS